MESRPQNHEFRINPENFHPCLTHKFLTYVLGDQKYRPIEMVLLGTHNIWFG